MKAALSRRQVGLALLLLALLMLASGGSGAGAVRAQDSALSPEDDAWAAAQSVLICAAAHDSDNDDEDCEAAQPVQGALRDCLRYTLFSQLAPTTARDACSRHVRNAGRFGPLTEFDIAAQRERLDRAIAGQVGRLQSLGLDQGTVDTFAAAVRPCALQQQLAETAMLFQDECPEAFRPVEAALEEAAVQQFETSLGPLLDQGFSAGDVLRAVAAFRSCVHETLFLHSIADNTREGIAQCEVTARVEAGLGRSTQGAPSVADVACSPNPAAAGALLSCSATVTGPATGVQWSAPGGSPNAQGESLTAGADGGRTVQFTTSFATSGTKNIELTACNRLAGTERDLCAVGRTSVEVTAVAPTIDGMSCTNGPVKTGDVVTCSASISGNTASATNRWSAPGGDPGDGRGLSFSTQFSRSGSFTITFRSCAGLDPLDGQGGDPRACAERTASVSVRDAAPKITALGCTGSVAVNAAVSCSPTIEGTVTSRTWTAAGGLPDSGNGPTFSTRFAAPGAKQVVLEACNGSACSTAFQPVTVTGEAKCTQWNITGTWQTTQGNGYSPTFAFQQSGTTISGTATMSAADASRAGFRSPSGPITGSLVGDQLSVTVTWTGQNGPVTGRYTATIVQGRLTNGNAGGQTWNGTGPTQCASQ